MKNINKVLLLVPIDDSLIFLNPIITIIEKKFTVTKHEISHDDQIMSHLSSVDIDDFDLIFFIGHGSHDKLCTGTYDNRTVYGGVQQIAQKFDDCSIFLLSCKSSQLLKNIKNKVELISFVGFGDLPTDLEHVKSKQQDDKNYWFTCEDKHIEVYKRTLVEAVSYGIVVGKKNNSFQYFNRGYRLIINKEINNILLDDTWSKQEKKDTIKMLIKLRDEISYSDVN